LHYYECSTGFLFAESLIALATMPSNQLEVEAGGGATAPAATGAAAIPVVPAAIGAAVIVGLVVIVVLASGGGGPVECMGHQKDVDNQCLTCSNSTMCTTCAEGYALESPPLNKKFDASSHDPQAGTCQFQPTEPQKLRGCTRSDQADECVTCGPGYKLDDMGEIKTCEFICLPEQESPTNNCKSCSDEATCVECKDGYKLVVNTALGKAECKFTCTVPGTTHIIEDTDYAQGACVKCLPPDSTSCEECREGYMLSNKKCVVDPLKQTMEQLDFYMYRAVNDADYPFNGINLASAGGVLSYLHVEVVSSAIVPSAHPWGYYDRPRTNKRCPPEGQPGYNKDCCTRKYGITRIKRFRVKMKNTPMVQSPPGDWNPNEAKADPACTTIYNPNDKSTACKYTTTPTGKGFPHVKNVDGVLKADPKGQFAQFTQFDKAQCTLGAPPVHQVCKDMYKEFGYVVGCQIRAKEQFRYPDAYWYSAPGTCPQKDYTEKSETIILKDWYKGDDSCNDFAPGGSCKYTQLDSEHKTPDGTPFCTYAMEDAGEVTVDELVGMCQGRDCKNFKWFCEEGRIEYNCPTDGHHNDPQTGQKCSDNGLALNFWKGYNDEGANQGRIQKLLDIFKRNYPDRGQYPDLQTPVCDFR